MVFAFDLLHVGQQSDADMKQGRCVDAQCSSLKASIVDLSGKKAGAPRFHQVSAELLKL